jgi:hypothetical protein
MATVTTLAPIAAQLARAVSLEVLFPRGAIDTVLRDHRSGAQSGEAELPEEVKTWLRSELTTTSSDASGSKSKNVLRGILRDWDTNRCWRSPRSEQPLLL